MKLNPDHKEELVGIVDRMKADRIPMPRIDAVVRTFISRKNGEYNLEAERIANANAAEQKAINDKKIKDQEERDALELKEKERVKDLGYKSEWHDDNVKTWVNKDEDDVVAKLKDLYPKVDFTVQPTGSLGNEVKITAPGFEGMEIDLNPWTQKGREQAEAQFNMFNTWATGQQEIIKKDGTSMNLLSGVDTEGGFLAAGQSYIESDDLARANKGYAALGMEIVKIPPKDFGTSRGVQHYKILKNGEEIGDSGPQGDNRFNPQQLQEYLANRDNYTEDERISFSNMAHEAAVRQHEVRKNIQNDPQYSVDKSTSKLSYSKSKQKFNDVNILFEGASEEDLKKVSSFLKAPIQSVMGTKTLEIDNWEKERLDNLFSDEVRNSLSEEGKLIFDKAKAKSLEKDKDGLTLMERSINNQNDLDNEAVWNAEYAERLREGDDQLIVRYNGKAGLLATEGEDGEVKVENLNKQKDAIDNNIKQATETYKKESEEDYRYAQDILSKARKDGVTLEIKKDDKGRNMYIAKGANAGDWQKEFNTIRDRENQTRSKFTTTQTVETNRYKNWLKSNQEHSKIKDIADREGDIGNIMLDQFNSGCASIGYSVPILFGSENAINMHQSRQGGAEAYEAALDYNTAMATGQGGRYGLITLAQQAPNIMLAVATQGVGTAFGAGATLASGLTATAFGVNSGTSKYADLTIQAGAGEEAKRQLEMLELNKDFMSHEEYVNAKAGLEEQVAMGNMTPNQILGQSLVTGLIEGGVAFGLGTIPNASKLVRGVIKGPGDDILNAITQKNLRYIAGAGLEFGKRTAGEVLEESIIHFGDVASESLILGREADFAGWEDVIASSVITGGAMNGPGIAYTATMNRLHTSDHRAKFNDSKNTIEQYKKDLTTPDLTDTEKDVLRNGIQEEYSKMVTLQNDMEITGMLLGGEGTKNLLKNGIVIDNLYDEAGVIPGDSQEVIDKKVEAHSGTLKGENKKNFDGRLKNALDQKQKLINSVDYTDGYRAWGDRGEVVHNDLMKKDPAYKKMDDRQRAVKIHETIKADIEQDMMREAKADPGIKAMVETAVYGGVDVLRDKRKTKSQLDAEDQHYLMYGRLFGGFKAEAVSKNISQELQAKDVLSDKRLKEMQVVQVSDKGFEFDIREMERKGELGPNETANDLIAEIKEGKTFGAIVGKKYIVTDQQAAAKNLADGQLLQGTVFSHEVKHAVDNRAFNEGEMRDYSGNLALWASENAAPIHAEALQRLQGNKHILTDDNNMPLPWDQQPDIVHREYGNYIQDALQRKQYSQYKKALYKNKPSLMNRIGGVFNADFTPDSPQNAAAYLADHMKAFDRGDMGKLAKRRIDNKKGQKINDGDGNIVKRSSNLQGILDQGYNGDNATKSDIARMVDNLTKFDFDGKPIVDLNQISALQFEVGGIIESITKRLYDKIPVENRRILSRTDYKQSLLTEATELIRNEYDASKQDLDKFISSRLNLRANDLAKRLGVEQGFTTDIDNATNILFDDDTDIDIDENGNIVEGATDFTNGLALTPEGLKVVLDHVQLNLGGILPSVTAEKGKNATVTPLVSELKKLFYKEKNPIQQTIEAAMGKTPVEVEVWLKDPKNKALILKHMPTTWLAKNMPKAVQKLVIQEDGTKEWTTDHVGRTKGTKPGQVDFYRSTEDGPYKGMTDGKQKIRRNPKAMTDITSIDLIKKFFNGTTMTELRRGGLDTLTRAMAQEIGLEQFRANVELDGDIAQMFKSRQELLHGELANNLTAQVIEQVERGVILRSEAGDNVSMVAYMNGVDSDKLIQAVNKIYTNGVDSKEARDVINKMPAEARPILDHITKELFYKGITKDNVRFLQRMTSDKDTPAIIREVIRDKGYKMTGKVKGIREIDTDKADPYIGEIKELFNTYTFSPTVIKLLGGLDIVGLTNRMLDSAKKKDDGTQARYYPDRMQLNDMLMADPVLDAIAKDSILINKDTTKLRNFYSPILHTNGTMSESLAHLDTIRDTLQQSNVANIAVMKDIALKINQAYNGADIDMSPETLVTLFQLQTGATKGFRGLSKVDYFMHGNFIDNKKFKKLKKDVDINTKEGKKQYDDFVEKLSKYDYYQERLAINKKANPDSELDAQLATYDDLTVKGEHLKANADTMTELLNAIANDKLTEAKFYEIVDGHTQFFGPNFIMDILDAELGQMSKEGDKRITLAIQNNPDLTQEQKKEILDRIIHISGRPAVDAIAMKELGVMKSSGDISKADILSKAAEQKYLDAENKGISILDFDDTLATSKSLVRFTRPDGTKGTLTPEQYAAEFENLADLGYTFDFTEFNKVVKGKIAPLFNKAKKLAGKFGTNDIFILTARPPAAQKAIHKFLKDNGLDLPIENITGLGNSTAEAKALWVAEKAGEGYNDFYFADDALKNVQAVKSILDQFDVKQKTTVADPNFVLRSKDKASTLNNMIARNLGVAEYKEYSDAKAKLVGKKKGRLKFFIPPSAEDFKGLLYPLLGKGAKGDADMMFFKETLFDPFSRGIDQINSMAQNLSVDFRNLNKKMPGVKKKLRKKIPGTEFTYDQGIRVYMWNKAGVEAPGISKADKKAILKEINKSPDIMEYADNLTKITKSPSYLTPTDSWLTNTIAQDLYGMTQGDTRKKMLAEFIENRKKLFGDWKNGRLNGPLMNKLEATLGTNWREAMEDMLWRMENGTNRNFGKNKLTNAFANWTNNSVGAIMFFNGRSAVLQTLSTVNFINWSDNNPLKAAAAFANQPQFWKDFAYLFNSDMLKQRRSGNKRSVSESELAQAAETGGPSAVLQKLLDFGFLPTQIADSFAIASGGATFYRNRVKSLMKKGMSRVEAEAQAFTDFQKITEETQQSSRPDMISSQQASPLGRLILAFQNTPMQYARLTKKAILDLKNGRGDTKTNISKIIYYGAVQNLIFGALQKAMFRFMFDDDDEDELKRKKTESLTNGMLDGFLRGMGVGGAVVSTLKNMLIKFIAEDKKGFNMDTASILIDMLNVSPPIGSKVRKVNTALRTRKFKRREMDHMDTWDMDNPVWSSVTQVISGLTNAPADRIYQTIMNLKEATNSDNETWQRLALMLGWNTWDVGV